MNEAAGGESTSSYPFEPFGDLMKRYYVKKPLDELMIVK
jgi:hypothetical protein